MTVISELLSRNIRIPLDASAVVYGNHISSQHVRPLLITVDAPGVAFGREAVRLAKMRINDPTENQYRVRTQMPSEIIYRNTPAKSR